MRKTIISVMAALFALSSVFASENIGNGSVLIAMEDDAFDEYFDILRERLSNEKSERLEEIEERERSGEEELILFNEREKEQIEENRRLIEKGREELGPTPWDDERAPAEEALFPDEITTSAEKDETSHSDEGPTQSPDETLPQTLPAKEGNMPQNPEGIFEDLIEMDIDPSLFGDIIPYLDLIDIPLPLYEGSGESAKEGLSRSSSKEREDGGEGPDSDSAFLPDAPLESDESASSSSDKSVFSINGESLSISDSDSQEVGSLFNGERGATIEISKESLPGEDNETQNSASIREEESISSDYRRESAKKAVSSDWDSSEGQSEWHGYSEEDPFDLISLFGEPSGEAAEESDYYDSGLEEMPAAEEDLGEGRDEGSSAGVLLESDAFETTPREEYEASPWNAVLLPETERGGSVAETTPEKRSFSLSDMLSRAFPNPKRADVPSLMRKAIPYAGAAAVLIILLAIVIASIRRQRKKREREYEKERRRIEKERDLKDDETSEKEEAMTGLPSSDIESRSSEEKKKTSSLTEEERKRAEERGYKEG